MTHDGPAFAVGDELPAFTRGAGFEYWNRYAAVNDEFVDIHMDDAAGRAAGYPSAFGMGNLTWAYFHAALHDWFGEGARIRRLSIQFRAAVVRGPRVSVRGVVTAVAPGPTVDVAIWAEDADGARLAPGAAVVEPADPDRAG